jgi:hypothetical protein
MALVVVYYTTITGTNGTSGCALRYYHRDWDKWHFCAFGNLLDAGRNQYDSIRNQIKCVSVTILEKL